MWILQKTSLSCHCCLAPRFYDSDSQPESLTTYLMKKYKHTVTQSIEKTHSIVAFQRKAGK